MTNSPYWDTLNTRSKDHKRKVIMNNKQIFTLCVRRWFHKTYGNSYYTMRVVCPDGSAELVEITYGHGHATYVDSAQKVIEQAGWTSENQKFIVDEVEVMRRKDLHNNGK